MVDKECDVLIIGAGMSGGMLARQLRLAMPELKIIIIDKKKTFDYWIGESTIEAWADYAYRICDLGNYLQKHQVVKHGLRFFFDSKEKNLPIREMSEVGRTAYTPDFYSHQVDRATFDRDLCEINSKSGVEVLLGTRIVGTRAQTPEKSAITLDRNAGHIVHTENFTIKCKWLIDAAGRTAPLARALDLVEDEPRHHVGSYWGRFEGMANIDHLGDDAWCKRVNHTLRYFSTNHFMYPGYWIWVIPLSDSLVSVGVSFHQEMVPLKLKNADEFTAFLRQHRAFQELMPEATTKAVDFLGFTSCARHTKQFFSTDRWALTGMSGFVIDALFSTSGYTTAVTNRLLGELIRADVSGDSGLFEKEVRHFNIYLQRLYEHILRRVSSYKELGSMDAWNPGRTAGFYEYYNLGLSEVTSDFDAYFKTVKSHSADCGCSVESSIKAVQDSVAVRAQVLQREMFEYLERTGRLFEGNRGRFTEVDPRQSVRAKLYSPRNPESERVESAITYEACFRTYLQRMAEFEKVGWHEVTFRNFFKSDWKSGQTLSMGLAALKDAQTRGLPDERSPIMWTAQGPRDEFGNELSGAQHKKLVRL